MIYIGIIRNILSESSKFTQVTVAEDKQLNFIVNVEKYIADFLKDLTLKLFLKPFIKV